MARGVPLTPRQTEKAADVYAQTGNMCAAADAIGVSESTLRGVFKRLDLANARELHQRACERGLRSGRRSQLASVAMIDRVLSTEETAGVSLEPKDLAVLVNAKSRLIETLVAIADREDRRRAGRLTRAKTRAETAALGAQAAGAASGDIRVVVRIAADGAPASVAVDAEARGDLPGN